MGNRLAENAQERLGDVALGACRRELGGEILQQPNLLERAPRACGHRRRAPGDQPLVGERDAILAEPLCLVERRVGSLRQVAQLGPVIRTARDAKRQGQLPAVEVGGREGALQAAADGARVGLRRRRQEHRKLLATEPIDAVGRAHASPQEPAGRAQRIVSRDVPARVVELFEVVDVGEHEREATDGLGVDQRLSGLVEAPVVREPGQRVGRGLELLALERPEVLERGGRVGGKQSGLVERVGGEPQRLRREPDQIAVQPGRRDQREADRRANALLDQGCLDRRIGALARPRVPAPSLAPGVLGDERRELVSERQRAVGVTRPRVREREAVGRVLGDLHAVEVERPANGAGCQLEHAAGIAHRCKAREGGPQQPIAGGQGARLPREPLEGGDDRGGRGLGGIGPAGRYLAARLDREHAGDRIAAERRGDEALDRIDDREEAWMARRAARDHDDLGQLERERDDADIAVERADGALVTALRTQPAALLGLGVDRDQRLLAEPVAQDGAGDVEQLVERDRAREGLRQRLVKLEIPVPCGAFHTSHCRCVSAHFPRVNCDLCE